MDLQDGGAYIARILYEIPVKSLGLESAVFPGDAGELLPWKQAFSPIFPPLKHIFI